MIAGKFRLTHQLGEGGMGSVWAAAHQVLGREVAVKFLQPQASNSDVLTNRFVSEAQMVASIKHRFVVDVFDFGVTEDGLHYMVLELLHGRSLAERMDHGPAMSVRSAVKLMADCLRGLHVVHEAGIVHRDLKPDNIFVIDDADGAFPKLIDFGISRRTDPPNLKLSSKEARKSRLTLPGVVLGTPFYMSPEQLRGKHSVDARSDIYSFGVMLYELLAGWLPFRQDNIGDLMVAITVTGAPPLQQIRPELGVQLSDVVARAMSPTAEQRYANALELRKALLQLLPELPQGAMCVVQNEIEAQCAREGRDAGGSWKPDTSTGPAALSPARSAIRLGLRAPARRHVLMAAAAVLAFSFVAWLWRQNITPEPVQAGLAPREATQTRTLAPLEPRLIEPAAPANATSAAENAPAAEAAAVAPADSAVAAHAAAAGTGGNSGELNTRSSRHERRVNRQTAAARKAARQRAHTRDGKARATSKRRKRIYRKLDF